VHGDVINLHAAFGQQLLDIAMGKAIAQISAHRRHDGLGWKPETGEADP
jgi:hypothetical protein